MCETLAACVVAFLSTVLLKWDFMVVPLHNLDTILYRHVDHFPYVSIH